MALYVKGEKRDIKPVPRYKLSVERKALNALIIEAGPRLIRRAIKMADDGDSAMIKLLIERMVPALKSVEVQVDGHFTINNMFLQRADRVFNSGALIETIEDGNTEIVSSPS